jgi:peptidyl-prolyl cis-trans isomerase A (cyclophilin A)
VAAPITATNFLRYVDEGRLDSANFYRVVTLDNQPDNDVKIEVIQGGLGNRSRDDRLDPIPHETTVTTGLLHTAGAISMARNEPGSASSEFFICVTGQPELDFGGRRNPDGQGFAVFGRVVAGMDVVRAIQRLPANGQRLTDTIEVAGSRVKD